MSAPPCTISRLTEDDAARFRRGIGSALLLSTAMWIGLIYAVLLLT